MTPEELNQTIEFIIQSQARLAAAQEQDRQDRIQFEEWSKGLTARINRLLEAQSGWLDRIDKFYQDWFAGTGQFHEEVRDFQERSLIFQERSLHMLQLILDRMPPRRDEPA